MRNAVLSALVAGLFVAGCGDDTGTGGSNGGGGSSNGGGGGTTDGGGGSTTDGGGGSTTDGGGGGGPDPECGDGVVDATEDCDDGGTTAADGCDGSCQVEAGFECDGEPSVCVSTCGDGALASDEDCDDSNVANLDGCSSMCAEESGWTCAGDPSVCDTTCGDSLIGADAEECDDGDATAGDGCDAACQVETGFSCAGEPSVCTADCGNGTMAGSEGCDDGDSADGDGCSSICVVEPGFGCVGTMPSVCTLSGSCADPIVVTGDGFVFQTANPIPFGDDLDNDDVSCVENDGVVGVHPDLVFEVSLTAGDTLHIAESGAADVLFHVLSGACASATTCADSADGIGATEIDPGLIFQSPTTQTVFVVIDTYNVAAATDAIDLLFQISPCGDGAVGFGEGCDDSDVTGGDGCSATCTVEVGFSCVGEPSVCTPLPGLSCVAPIVASDGFAFAGSNIAAFGDDLDYTAASCADVAGATFDSPEMVFQIGLTAGQRLNVADLGNLDLVFQVLQPMCGNDVTCVGEYDDDSGGGETAGLTYLATVTGTHFVVVESYSAAPAAAGTFDVRFNIATCGDGAVEFGEPCDDGNLNPNDGCNASCVTEAGFTCVGSPSVCTGLPAASCANPIVVTGNAFTFAGTNINQFLDTENYNLGTNCLDVSTTPPSGFDVVFRADMLAGQTVQVRELGGLDAIIHILQTPLCGAGTTCTASTDFGEVAGITFTAVAAGPVFIVVESFGNPLPTTTYDIRIDRFQCGDGVIGGSETCDDGGTTAGNGCSATCQVEAGFECHGTPSVCTTIAGCAATDTLCFLGTCTGPTLLQVQTVGLPLAIPDNLPAGATSTITVPATAGTIQRVVLRFGATHTFDSDLDISLTGPTGPARDASSDNGGGGDNFINTMFRDGVPNSITTGVAPMTGVFRPEALFGAFSGQAATGAWALGVVDDAGGDLGSITNYELGFCMTP